MAKAEVAKKYVVDYKDVNTALIKKRGELEKLKKKVNLKGKIEIELQIKAMNVLIAQCKVGKMSKAYQG